MKISDTEAVGAVADARRRKMVLERAVAQMVVAYEEATGLRVEHVAVSHYNPQSAYPTDAKLSCTARVVLP